MRDADIRSTERTKCVSFTSTRLRYEFKLATVFWLKLLLVSNTLYSFQTRRRSVNIRHCVLFTAQRGTWHSRIVLLPNCADSFSAGLATTAESNSETAHCTVPNCVSKRWHSTVYRWIDRRITRTEDRI